MPASLRTYAALARASYRAKLMAAAALGAAVPVATAGAYLACARHGHDAAGVAPPGGVATLGAAAVGALLVPVTLTAAALRTYLTRSTKSALPLDLADVDGAGAPMADAQHAVERRPAVARSRRDGRPVGVDERLGNAHRFYSADPNARPHPRAALEADLRHALERGQLFLHYQPKVDVATGRVRGFEALLRWRHPERGLVSPVEFIPAAEATGLIVPIGEWVLRTACAQMAAWRAEGLPPAAVAVNLSARQFQHADLVATVHAALADHGIDPARLELEVTESLLMDDTAHTVAVLRALRAEGVGISLDDFGTGYSSLGYLKRFPLDCIKLDKSFVRDAVTDRQSAAITEAIIALGHSLDLEVVAEGVETPEQLAYLAERGCDVVQGFLFGRPMPAEAAAEVLRTEAGLPRPWLRAA